MDKSNENVKITHTTLTSDEMLSEYLDDLEKIAIRKEALEDFIYNIKNKNKWIELDVYEFLEENYRNDLKDILLCYCWYRLPDYPRDIYRIIKKFIQRGIRGWADEDVWSGDYYLSKIITGMVKRLKEIGMGIPSELFDENNKSNLHFHNAEKKWERILDSIIWTFEMAKLYGESDIYIQKSENYSIKEANKWKRIYNRLNKKYSNDYRVLTKKECRKFEKGLDNFTKYFLNLND